MINLATIVKYLRPARLKRILTKITVHGKLRTSPTENVWGPFVILFFYRAASVVVGGFPR